MTSFYMIVAVLSVSVGCAMAAETTKIEVTFVPTICDMKSQSGDEIYWNYDGQFTNGTHFVKNKHNTVLGAGNIIKGLDQGMRNMCVGEKRKLTIPHTLAYGAEGFATSIPPYATLIFDVELYFLERPGRKNTDL